MLKYSGAIILFMFISCKTHHTDMKEFKNLVNQRNFIEWNGFPENFKIEDITVVHEDNSYSGIPVKDTKRYYCAFDGYLYYPELFVFDNKPLKLLINFPDIQNTPYLLEKLKNPSFKRDFYLNTSHITNGELVYLEEGIALQVDNRNESEIIYQIVLFNPCSKDYYIENIARESNKAEEF